MRLKYVVEAEPPVPGENAGVSGEAAPPAATSLDDALSRVFNDVDKATKAAEAVAPPTATPVTPVTPVTPATIAPPPVGQPTAAAGLSPEVAQMMAQMSATQAATVQALQQMSQRFVPAEQPKAAPKAPTALELAKTFTPPPRDQGEDDTSYVGRTQASLLDHVNQGQWAFYQKQADERSAAAIRAYDHEIRQQFSQQVQAQQAQQAFSSALEGAVKAGGLDPASDVGRFAHDTVRQQLATHAATNPATRSWSDQQWLDAMRLGVDRVKTFLRPAPTPGQAPQLSVVSAPISGGGTTTPTQPSSGTAPVAKDFNGALDNLWAGVSKASGS